MKVKVELTTKNNDNTRVLRSASFNTDIEKDGERFFSWLDDNCPHQDLDSFVELVISRLD